MEPRVPGDSGYCPCPAGGVWYLVEGGRARVPLLVLHGGPGFTHDLH